MPEAHIFSYRLLEHPRNRPRRSVAATVIAAGVLAALLIGALLGAGAGQNPDPSPSPTTTTGTGTGTVQHPSWPAPAAITP
jgi:cell division protein FtsN